MSDPEGTPSEWIEKFDLWKKSYQEFRRLEEDRILAVDEPEKIDRFFHRTSILELLLRAEVLRLNLDELDLQEVRGKLDVWVTALEETWELSYSAFETPAAGGCEGSAEELVRVSLDPARAAIFDAWLARLVFHTIRKHEGSPPHLTSFISTAPRSGSVQQAHGKQRLPRPESKDEPQFQPLSRIEHALPVSRASCLTLGARWHYETGARC